MAESRSKVQTRKHLSLDPKPMYVDEGISKDFVSALGLPMEQKRTKCKLDVRDMTDSDEE